MQSILSHKITQIITTIIILLSAYIIIYPPHIGILERTSEYAPILMFGMLFISFIFLIFNQRRLMFIGMMATAFIAFFLKISGNDNLVLPEQNTLPKLKVAYFNLSTFNKENPELDKLLKEVQADVICLQEFTPDWDIPIASMLRFSYPHVHKMTRVDPFGMAVFSSKPFKEIKTFYYKGIPNLILTIDNELQDIDIVSSYIPLFYPQPKMNREEHLQEITTAIKGRDNPVIAMGDYNKVYWQLELIQFRNSTLLNNSRRSTALSAVNPYDHIFYSDDLECVQFDELLDSYQNHIGITGTYQITSNLRSQRKTGFERDSN